ncbi:exopolygalacturonase-like [Malania oleifera]|uniref:exopolygalacturonase-like n=1 Tax=Malania oleifera TaxID=397392 RepID=UPI0025AE9EFE|nr:exopolygalacturonase-like [Malania oleifera]
MVGERQTVAVSHETEREMGAACRLMLEIEICEISTIDDGDFVTICFDYGVDSSADWALGARQNVTKEFGFTVWGFTDCSCYNGAISICIAISIQISNCNFKFNVHSNVHIYRLIATLSVAQFAHSAVFDVSKYGAKADGSDAAQGLLGAWKEACASAQPSKVTIPKGNYVVGEVAFVGPCKAPIQFQVAGTLKASPDPSHFKTDGWIKFQNVDHLSIFGGGTFDGQGTLSWTKNQCSKSLNCKSLPTNVRFDFLTNSEVRDITSLNSKMFHTNILGCKNLTLNHVTITAPATSANTDGIHIGRSDGINITDCHIQTGDDCVSLGDGSKHVTITGVTCGPGHGIAVGSLGKFKNEEDVVGITVRNCTLTGTMFGVRVKTWPSSPAGIASDMHFEDIIMNQVSTPVLIDQEYCPWNQCTGQIPSKVKVSNVSFKNIRGTSATQVAVKLACSKGVPCENVQVSDIHLAYSGKEGPATSVISNVKPIISGQQFPPLKI